jgi:hypothetical protein
MAVNISNNIEEFVTEDPGVSCKFLKAVAETDPRHIVRLFLDIRDQETDVFLYSEGADLGVLEDKGLGPETNPRS